MPLIETVQASKVKQGKLSYLWKPWLPTSGLAILEGRKGDGKSSTGAAIAAYVSGGPRLPEEGTRRKRQKRGVLWVSSEEDAGIHIRPRLHAAGADLASIRVIAPGTGCDGTIRLPSRAADLRDTIEHHEIGLVVFDPYISCLDREVSVTDEQSIRPVLEKLARIGYEMDCLILLIRHIRKACGDARDAGLGSVAVGNTARTILRVDRDPEHRGHYLMWCVATNMGEKPPPLRWTRVCAAGGFPSIEWLGVSDLDPEDLAENPADSGERDARKDAVRFLESELVDREEIPVRDLLRKATETGITLNTLRRAKKDLGILSVQVRDGDISYWLWKLPEGHTPSAAAE